MSWKLTKEEAKQLLQDLENQSKAGRNVADEIEVTCGLQIVGIGFTCIDPKCNCVGGWWNRWETNDETWTYTKEELQEICNS